jgi:hypothetical protein
MADQLSLFPSAAPDQDTEDLAVAERNALDELLLTTKRWQTSTSFEALLAFIGRFPHYSPFNALLLYLQNPHCTKVATARVWRQTYGRRPRYNAKPLIILAPMSPVRFVYDIQDTEGDAVAQTASDQESPGQTGLPEGLYSCCLHNCDIHGIAVRKARAVDWPADDVLPVGYETRKRLKQLNLSSAVRYLIRLDPGLGAGAEYGGLAEALAHIFCGHIGIDDRAWWPDRRFESASLAELEAKAVAYLVTSRLGLYGGIPEIHASLAASEASIAEISLQTIIQATDYIEKMGQSRWQQPKRPSRYRS